MDSCNTCVYLWHIWTHYTCPSSPYAFCFWNFQFPRQRKTVNRTWGYLDAQALTSFIHKDQIWNTSKSLKFEDAFMLKKVEMQPFWNIKLFFQFWANAYFVYCQAKFQFLKTTLEAPVFQSLESGSIRVCIR